jgi:hypothetical protein
MTGHRHGVTIDVLPTAVIAPPTWYEIWQLSQTLYDTERGYVERVPNEHQRIVLFRTRALKGLRESSRWSRWA